jgi:hypothetical protein
LRSLIADVDLRGSGQNGRSERGKIRGWGGLPHPMWDQKSLARDRDWTKARFIPRYCSIEDGGFGTGDCPKKDLLYSVGRSESGLLFISLLIFPSLLSCNHDTKRVNPKTKTPHPPSSPPHLQLSSLLHSRQPAKSYQSLLNYPLRSPIRHATSRGGISAFDETAQ